MRASGMLKRVFSLSTSLSLLLLAPAPAAGRMVISAFDAIFTRDLVGAIQAQAELEFEVHRIQQDLAPRRMVLFRKPMSLKFICMGRKPKPSEDARAAGALPSGPADLAVCSPVARRGTSC